MRLCVCATVAYERVSPESSFIAVVSLLVAHVTLVVSGFISNAQLAQRRGVLSGSGDAAGIEEICHT